MTSRIISFAVRQRSASSLLRCRCRRFETSTTCRWRRSTAARRFPATSPYALRQSRRYSAEKLDSNLKQQEETALDRASPSAALLDEPPAAAIFVEETAKEEDMFQSMEQSIVRQMENILRRRPSLEEKWLRTQYSWNRKRRKARPATETTPVVSRTSSQGGGQDEDESFIVSTEPPSNVSLLFDDTDHAVEPSLSDVSSLFEDDGHADTEDSVDAQDSDNKTIAADNMDSMTLSELLEHDIEDNVFATTSEVKNDDIEEPDPVSVSLMDLLDDDDEQEVTTAAPPESDESLELASSDDHHHVSLEQEEHDMSSYYDEDVTSNDHSSSPLQSAVDRGVALLVVMEGRDWAALLDNKTEQQRQEAFDSPEDVVTENEAQSNVEEEHLVDDFFATDESDAAAVDTLSDMTALDRVRIFLHDAKSNEDTLSTSEYNLLLLELALFPSSTEDVFQNMLAVYGLMKELSLVESQNDSAPDINTFLIMMLALSGRGQAPSDAALVCRDMIASGVELNSAAISAVMKVLEKEKRLREAETFLNQLLKDENRDVAIPAKAFLSLMQMYRNENRHREAVALIKSCMMEMGDFGHYGVSKLLQAAIHWPDRDRHGKRIDSSALLLAILEILEPSDDPLMFDMKNKVSFIVWKRLIERISSEGTPESNMLIARAFAGLSSNHKTFFPSPSMLKIGLRAAEALRDADLACDLVVRARQLDPHPGQSQSFQELSPYSGHDEHGIGDLFGETEITASEEDGHHDFVQTKEEDSAVAESTETMPSTTLDENGLVHLFGEEEVSSTVHEGTFEGESAQRSENAEPSVAIVADSTHPADLMPLSRPPPRAFMTAMEISVGTGNMKSVQRLIDCLDAQDDDTPLSVKNRIYSLALKGFAKTADADSALNVLERLRRGGAEPTEEAYGAVMHSLVASRRTHEAHQLFKSLERNERSGVMPGPTCFDASMLACLQTGDWDKALELHEKRLQSSVPLTPAGFQGALIASFRCGNRRHALKYAKEMLGSNTELDQACCEVSMKILLRDLVPQSDIRDTRRKLRAICEEDPELHSASIALLRSLRIAEAEQKRRVSNALTEKELSRRRQKAWREALFHVVDLMKTADEQGKLLSSASPKT